MSYKEFLMEMKKRYENRIEEHSQQLPYSDPKVRKYREEYIETCKGMLAEIEDQLRKETD